MNHPQIERRTPVTKSPAVFLPALLVLAAAWFGASRDFGVFLLQFLVLPLLLLAAVAALIFLCSERRHRRIGWFLIGLSLLVYFTPSYQLVQRVRFLAWAPAHYEMLADASKRDQIIMGWDSWGMAGEDTFSYLVADTKDDLRSKARIDQWTKQMGQTCGAWEVSKVWSRLYLVTTYTNCPYDGIMPAG